MKVPANTIRPGHVIELNNKLWVTQKMQIVSPGKGGAFVQAELKEIRTGTKLNEKFRTDETLEKIQVEDFEMQYLYAEGDQLTFMNQENFEQITVPREIVGDAAIFLQDNMICTIQMHETTPLTVTLPKSVVLDIVEADPVVKGQTASSSYKPAKLSNGARVMVPPHIGQGDRVVVNTEDGSYIERAKD
ncbi:MAG: elongation factor P [Alphaproteobacteria bacterium]|nr:elongation factor P [Alphaproteobacteria bacterium]